MKSLATFQSWLNEHGAAIAVDGKAGPKTRAAILSVFANRRAPAATEHEVRGFAWRLGGSYQQLRAVARVESAGSGFDDAGRPKALFERHYAWKRLRVKIPLLSDPVPGGYTIDADRDGINDSWEKIADLAMRNPGVAFESASFGKFQIMGAWAERLGYAGAVHFAWALTRSEAEHYEALCRYIERFGLKAAFQALSTDPETCRAFAAGYNGPAYARGRYHEKLAEAMR